jgi:hypothetical protein
VVNADAREMLDSSIGAAAAFGSVELVTDDVIAAGGASRSMSVVHERLSATRAGPSRVTFDGEIDLRVTISGHSPFTSVERITGPVQVVRRHGWKVERFTFDGRPLVYYPEGTRQTVRGIHLAVAFVLSYATSSSVVVGVQSSHPNLTVYLRRVRMQSSSGSTAPGRAFFGHGLRTGLLGFARLKGRPTHLTITFGERDGSKEVFSLALPGRPQ